MQENLEGSQAVKTSEDGGAESENEGWSYPDFYDRLTGVNKPKSRLGRRKLYKDKVPLPCKDGEIIKSVLPKEALPIAEGASSNFPVGDTSPEEEGSYEKPIGVVTETQSKFSLWLQQHKTPNKMGGASLLLPSIGMAPLRDIMNVPSLEWDHRYKKDDNRKTPSRSTYLSENRWCNSSDKGTPVEKNPRTHVPGGTLWTPRRLEVDVLNISEHLGHSSDSKSEFLATPQSSLKKGLFSESIHSKEILPPHALGSSSYNASLTHKNSGALEKDSVERISTIPLTWRKSDNSEPKDSASVNRALSEEKLNLFKSKEMRTQPPLLTQPEILEKRDTTESKAVTLDQKAPPPLLSQIWPCTGISEPKVPEQEANTDIRIHQTNLPGGRKVTPLLTSQTCQNNAEISEPKALLRISPFRAVDISEPRSKTDSCIQQKVLSGGEIPLLKQSQVWSHKSVGTLESKGLSRLKTSVDISEQRCQKDNRPVSVDMHSSFRGNYCSTSLDMSQLVGGPQDPLAAMLDRHDDTDYFVTAQLHPPSMLSVSDPEGKQQTERSTRSWDSPAPRPINKIKVFNVLDFYEGGDSEAKGLISTTSNESGIFTMNRSEERINQMPKLGTTPDNRGGLWPDNSIFKTRSNQDSVDRKPVIEIKPSDVVTPFHNCPTPKVIENRHGNLPGFKIRTENKSLTSQDLKTNLDLGTGTTSTTTQSGGSLHHPGKPLFDLEHSNKVPDHLCKNRSQENPGCLGEQLRGIDSVGTSEIRFSNNLKSQCGDSVGSLVSPKHGSKESDFNVSHRITPENHLFGSNISQKVSHRQNEITALHNVQEDNIHGTNTPSTIRSSWLSTKQSLPENNMSTGVLPQKPHHAYVAAHQIVLPECNLSGSAIPPMVTLESNSARSVNPLKTNTGESSFGNDRPNEGLLGHSNVLDRASNKGHCANSQPPTLIMENEVGLNFPPGRLPLNQHSLRNYERPLVNESKQNHREVGTEQRIKSQEHHQQQHGGDSDEGKFKKPMGPAPHKQPHQSSLSPLTSDDHTLFVNGKPYTVLSSLGRGGSSIVYQVLDPKTSNLLAVKCVNLSMVDDIIATGYLNEIELLSHLQGCPSVITMFDHEYIRETKTLYVVMEKGDVDLSKLIRGITKTQQLSMSMIIYYWTEMLTAVKAIHDRGIIHSDLKPANFLLVCGRLKLIDFGIASSLQGDMTSVFKQNITGTSNYISPEAVQPATVGQPGAFDNQWKISYKSDVWSLGCILHNMVYGRTPFSHVTRDWAKLDMIADPKVSVELPPVDGSSGGRPITGELRAALEGCLLKDPRSRPSVSALLQLNYHLLPGPDSQSQHLYKLNYQWSQHILQGMSTAPLKS